MTISKLTSDGPEWMLYDVDFRTPLGILNQYSDATLQLKFNDSGSGKITIPITSPMAALIKPCQFVGLNYRGSFRGGFFVENSEIISVTSSEYQGLGVKISGRGMLSYVGRAVLWDWWTPSTDDVRYFGPKNKMPDGGHNVPMGEIIYKVLCEARDIQINPSGQHLERYCYHVGGTSGGAILLDWDFTATHDSNSVAWSDSGAYEFRVMTNLLDMLKQFSAAQYDFTIERLTDGTFMLHGYNARIGSDLSNSVIFRRGLNCMEVSQEQNAPEIVNALLLEFSDPVDPFTDVSDGTSMGKYGRWESGLQVSNTSDKTTAEKYGNAELAAKKEPQVNTNLKVTDVEKMVNGVDVIPHVFLDYNLADIIGYDGGNGSIQPWQVNGLQLSWTGDNQFADVVVEIATA